MSDTRPCEGCERGSPFTGDYDYKTQCRVCYLFHNDVKYHALYTGQAIPDVPHDPHVAKIDPECVKKVNETRALEKGFATIDQPEPKQYPPKTTQVASFVAATTEWVKAGKPERTEEEQKRIHTICESCEFFDSKQDRCMKCGCGLSSNASTSWIGLFGIPDAIRQSTHHCPIGKW